MSIEQADSDAVADFMAERDLEAQEVKLTADGLLYLDGRLMGQVVRTGVERRAHVIPRGEALA